MHYNANLCGFCPDLEKCQVLWGEACRVQGGKKIPRMSEAPSRQWRADWERAEQEERARQQAVRDQLRAAGEANAVRTRPWAAGE